MVRCVCLTAAVLIKCLINDEALKMEKGWAVGVRPRQLKLQLPLEEANGIGLGANAIKPCELAL